MDAPPFPSRETLLEESSTALNGALSGRDSPTTTLPSEEPETLPEDVPSTTLVATLFAPSTAPPLPGTTPAPLTTILTSLLSPHRVTLLKSTPLTPHILQILYTTTSPTPQTTLRHALPIKTFESSRSLTLTLHIQPPPISLHHPLKLAVFDLDSTLICNETIDELARPLGLTAAVSAITERAMAGELDFAASLRERVALLKGVRADTIWEEVKARIVFAPGARELCRALRKLGVKMAVLSGGFVPIAEWVGGELGLDVAVANHLLIEPPTPTTPYPTLSGLLSPTHPIIDGSQKRLHLESLSAENHIPLHETLVVGDGANDLEMLNLAGSHGGLGVAFRAKEKVQREAPNRLNSDTLVDLLYLLGYTEGEVEQLIKE
ncbi:hypothetical protein MMC20_001446 [Loxospora ochrophaea]|nr:hypothetical protein [Loxospora ochrophaea]